MKENYNLEFLVTEEIQEGFMMTFNDRNPVHVSDDYARQAGFDKRIMHGNILNGFISYFVGEILRDLNVVIIGQSINFYNPYYSNETLLFEAVLAEHSEAVNYISYKFKFLNKDNKKVAKGKVQLKQL